MKKLKRSSRSTEMTAYRSGKSVIVEVGTSAIDPLTESFEDVTIQIQEAIDIALSLLEKHQTQ